MHDLARIVEATCFRPPAWNHAAPDVPAIPLWWFMDAAASGKLVELGEPPVAPRADAMPPGFLDVPGPVAAWTEARLAGLWKRVLARGARKTATAAACDVVAWLPARGWPRGFGRMVDHADLGPVVAELQRRGHAVTALGPWLQDGPRMAARRAAKRRAILGDEWAWLDAGWDRTADAAFRETRQEVLGRWRRPADLAATGFDVTPAKQGAFLAWLRGKANALAFHAGLIVAATNVLRPLRARVLATTRESSPLCRAVQVAARGLGMRCIAVQHGWISPTHPAYAFAAPGALEARQVEPALPDAFAAWGERYEGILTKHGPWGPERVVVTGSVRHDGLSVLRQAAPGGVLWATQMHGATAEDRVASLAAVKHLAASGVAVVVKTHPEERKVEHTYASVLAAGATRSGESLLDGLGSASVLITRNSTAAVEAAALGRPVVVLDTTGGHAGTDFVSQGIALAAHDGPSLVRAVQQAPSRIAGKDQARYVLATLGPRDGKAASRVADLIESVAGPRRAPAKAAKPWPRGTR